MSEFETKENLPRCTKFAFSPQSDISLNKNFTFPDCRRTPIETKNSSYGTQRRLGQQTEVFVQNAVKLPE